MRQVEWKNIIADLTPRLFRYFAGAGLQGHAEDLIQETLIRLVRKVENGEFDYQKSQLATYAYGIARYVRLEAYKSNSRVEYKEPEKFHEVPCESETSEENLMIHSELVALRAAIARLEDVEQEVILLMIDKDLTLKEIGEVLKLPINTVKSHVRRAKHNLKQMLKVNKGKHYE